MLYFRLCNRNFCSVATQTPYTFATESGEETNSPQKGDFVLIDSDNNSWASHVAIYLYTDGDEVYMLGGNQGKEGKVNNTTHYNVNRCTFYRPNYSPQVTYYETSVQDYRTTNLRVGIFKTTDANGTLSDAMTYIPANTKVYLCDKRTHSNNRMIAWAWYDSYSGWIDCGDLR